MTKPLTAWWWKLHNNYGDLLNAAVLAHVSGRNVAWANQNDAELIAIGSILRTARDRVNGGGSPIYVWGSGMVAPLKADFMHGAVLSLVRGPLTATLLGMDDLPQGDPGLLVDEVFGITGTSKSHTLGIIPHWSHSQNPEIKDLSQAFPDALVIDMVTEDIEETTRQIASCEMILSSSLHGLIVADSLGIPNCWIYAGPIGKTSHFKFFDYALSVGRAMQEPNDVNDIITMGVPTPNTTYFAGLPAIKQTIKNAFPQELAA